MQIFWCIQEGNRAITNSNMLKQIFFFISVCAIKKNPSKITSSSAQSVTVPILRYQIFLVPPQKREFSGTGTKFFRYHFFLYQYWFFFYVLNFTDTSSFFCTKFYRCRFQCQLFRYHLKKNKKSWDRGFTLWSRIYNFFGMFWIFAFNPQAFKLSVCCLTNDGISRERAGHSFAAFPSARNVIFAQLFSLKTSWL